jgi:hypothetical protein
MDFYVEALNVSVDATKALLQGATDASFIADVVAEVDFPLADALAMFHFQSDAIDVNNIVTEDLKYKLNYTADSNVTNGVPDTVMVSGWLSNTICTGTDTSDATYLAGTSGAAHKAVPFEYVRYLAQNLFNTHLGVDLFSNETEVREDMDASARSALDAALSAIRDLSGGDFVEAGTQYNSFAHPSQSILEKIIALDASRLSDLSPYLVSGGDDSGADPANPEPTFKVPFIVGDTLQFKLTVSADANQSDIVGGVNAIADRTYRIVMNIVA